MLARRPDPSAEPSTPNSAAVETAFAEAPDTVVAEIVDGELHTSPRPGRRHANAASVLGGELHAPFRRGHGGPGGWVILVEPELHLGPKPDKLVPDLAGWRRERLPDLFAADQSSAFFDLAPDWVCEVLSAGTEAFDRVRKMRVYAREGIGHAWLVNPVTQTLEVYRLENAHWVLVDTYEADAAVRAPPFESFELSLSLLWER